MTVTRKNRKRSVDLRQRMMLPALMSLLPLSFAEQAQAACTPAAPVTDSVVTCTGATNNQNGTNGYGDPANARNTINVQAGASVTGTSVGIRVTGNGPFADADTINNFGAISGDTGVFGFSGIVNNNAGATITGVNGTGYRIFSQGTLANSGTISGTIRGVDIQNGTVTNNSTGTISGGDIGVNIQDDGLQTGGNPSVTNAGAITGGTTGVRFGSVGNETAELSNSGAISGTGVNGIGVLFNFSGIAANSGTIQATGSNGIAIQAVNSLEVNNSNGGAISGRIVGIQAGGTAIVNNAQGAVIEATEPTFVAAAISTVGQVSVQNSGTIRALGLSASGIAGAGVTVNNSSTGIITATRQAITTTDDGSVNNEGLIEANSSTSAAIIGFGAGTNLSVTNGGTIRAIGGNSTGIAAAGTATVANGAGLIQTTGQDSSTIFGTNVNVTGNSGTIEATGINGVAILATDKADVINSGTIQSTGDNGQAIRADNAVINNSAGGTIVGNSGAVRIDTGTINNAGTLSSTKSGTSISTIFAAIQTTVNNSGTIFVPNGGFGIGSVGRVALTNSGTISGIDNGIGISAAFADVTNSGTINTGSHAIVAATGNIQNFGTVQALSGTGITIESGTINNAASISGSSGINIGVSGTINNSGSIQSTAAGGVGVLSPNAFNIVNSGTISGNSAIQALGQNNVGSVITNSGTIAGTGGTAIKLSPAADTLTLLPGSNIVGAIDMGGGADTININNIVSASRVSSVTALLPTNTILQNVINFTGTVNTGVVGNAPGMPSVTTQTQFATLDPTAFGQADRTLMDFTGGISSLVQGRLGGAAANVSERQVVSFAPTSASGRTNEAFAAISAMAYGPQAAKAARTMPRHAWSSPEAPYNVWASGFGGVRAQKGDDLMLRSNSSAWAGVIGIDRQVRPDLLLGAFAGGGAGQFSTELDSQSVDTDYIAGGVYGRFDWSSYFLDFTVQAGATRNQSVRLVLNNLAPGGSENATASYNGWYVSPEVAFGRHYGFGYGYTLTPVLRLRYLAGMFDGYSEAGSVQNLAVKRRTLHDIEERAELALSKITGMAGGALKTSVYGGLIALQRLGGPTVDTVLIGQNLSFTTPGEDSAIGVLAGAGFDLRASERVSLFGTFEGTVMSDRSRTAAAKGGLRVAF